MKSKAFCNQCDKETWHRVEQIYQDWQDESIPDEYLSSSEVISRINGDIPYHYECLECGMSYEML